VVKRLHLYPFTKQTVTSLVVTFIFFAFILEFPFTPIISIGFQINLVTLLYVYINYKFVISIEINQVLDVVLKKIEAQTIILIFT
jgi:hypothetical protein